MGRMKHRDFLLVKKRLMQDGCYESGSELVRGLIGHVEAIESELHEVVAKFGQSERNVDRLTENVAQLKRENQRLMDEVDAAREVKKVKLPKKVADDLERFVRIGCDLPDIIYTFASGADKGNQKFADYAADNFHTLLSALINGYTIEEPPTTEDHLRTELTPKIEEWLRAPAAWGVEKARDELLKLIIPVVRRVLAEDRQEE